MDLTTLRNEVQAKNIVAAITTKGTKARFFISTCGQLCVFKRGSSKRGYFISEYDMKNFTAFIGKPKEKTEDELLKDRYKPIGKYKKLAMQASFTSKYIVDCQNLPDFEDWVKDQKPLFELGITTGNSIDGQVISLSRIGKKYPREIAKLREDIKNQREGQQLSYGKFAGYDISISTQVTHDGGFVGFLSLEFANCGNGYYYLLINDEKFIGYDVD